MIRMSAVGVTRQGKRHQVYYCMSGGIATTVWQIWITNGTLLRHYTLSRSFGVSTFSPHMIFFPTETISFVFSVYCRTWSHPNETDAIGTENRKDSRKNAYLLPKHFVFEHFSVTETALHCDKKWQFICWQFEIDFGTSWTIVENP